MIRFLLTHDLDTMTKYANERIVQGLPLAGLPKSLMIYWQFWVRVRQVSGKI
jgi:hypothetical protein